MLYVKEREPTGYCHELTVDFPEEGTIRYLGNHILDEGASQIPLYRYRVSQ